MPPDQTSRLGGGGMHSFPAARRALALTGSRMRDSVTRTPLTSGRWCAHHQGPPRGRKAASPFRSRSPHRLNNHAE